MKHCQKVWHTSYVGGKNPAAELNKHLRMYRATPHPTTGKSPSEVLFGRTIHTRIQNLETQPSAKLQDIRAKDQHMKLKQKMYKDAKSYIKPHNINIGDRVLLSQKKSKLNPPYDPSPYLVTEIRGHQVTAQRDHAVKTRDAQKWKKISTKPPVNYDRKRQIQAELKCHQDDILLDFTATPTAAVNHEPIRERNNHQAVPQRNQAANSANRPPRVRRRPDFFQAGQ